MNKIVLTDKKINKKLDDNIDVEIFDNEGFFGVKKIIIAPKIDSKLEIEYKEKSFKADIEINIKENINFDLFEIRYNDDIKVRYIYNIDSSSTLNVVKFYDCKNVRELDEVNLNGEFSNVNFTLKTIANSRQNFDLKLNHNSKNTISNVVNSGVNVDGEINFNVEGIVPNGNSGCELDQNNRIINFTDNLCTIEPKLLIEEEDVVANHAALIGKFEEEELFYLMSRGIDYNSAVVLLVKGFLIEDMNDKRLDKIIEKYWR